MRHFRYYQEEASQAICSELQNQDKCLVKMFCGTGKSLLMRQCPVNQDKNMVFIPFSHSSIYSRLTTNKSAQNPPEIRPTNPKAEISTLHQRYKTLNSTNALLLDGYEYEGTREYANDCVADFQKEISYTDTAGNWINDSKIKVSIQFEKRVDYAHIKKDANGDDVYVGNSETFISDIIDEIKNENTK